jgi:hypothetical protein
MTDWFSVVGALVMVAALCFAVIRRPGPREERLERDPDWGDWPSDQMGT